MSKLLYNPCDELADYTDCVVDASFNEHELMVIDAVYIAAKARNVRALLAWHCAAERACILRADNGGAAKLVYLRSLVKKIYSCIDYALSNDS